MKAVVGRLYSNNEVIFKEIIQSENDIIRVSIDRKYFSQPEINRFNTLIDMIGVKYYLGQDKVSEFLAKM